MKNVVWSRSVRSRLVLGAALVAVVASTGCGRSGQLLVGRAAEDPDVFVAVASDDMGRAIAYVCDGEESGLQMLEWFEGEDAPRGLDLDNGTMRLQVARSDAGGTGGVGAEGGEGYTFALEIADGDAGLYRADGFITDEQLEQVEYVAGWIIDNLGEQRGGVRLGGGVGQNVRRGLGPLDVKTGRGTLPDGTPVTAEPVFGHVPR